MITENIGIGNFFLWSNLKIHVFFTSYFTQKNSSMHRKCCHINKKSVKHLFFYLPKLVCKNITHKKRYHKYSTKDVIEMLSVLSY